MVRIKPVNNYLVVEMQEEKTPDYGTLVLPDSAKKNPRWAKVLGVGPGAPDFDGNIVPLDVAEGDLVYVAAHGKEEIDLSTAGGKGKVTACSVLDVLGIIDPTTMDFQPLGNYIVIEKLDPPEKKDGLYLPDSRKQAPNVGIVKRLGKGWRTTNGRDVPFQVKEGDTVVYREYQTMFVDLEHFGQDKPVHLIQHGDILGVVEAE